MEKKYYEKFPQEEFEELKSIAKKIWMKIDPTYEGPAKSNQIDNIENIKDNGMYILSMFDIGNILVFRLQASDKLNHEIKVRLESVNEPLSNYF
jgi:Ser-tRNA(Ala) deacylase AlaX